MVVVPSAAVSVWEIEAQEVGMKTQVLRGTSVDKAALRSGADLFVTTYGSIPYQAPYFRQLACGPRINTLIMDEAHFVHKKGLTWTKAINTLGVNRRICTTNTPARNRIRSLYGVLDCLQGTPRPWGTEWDFRKRYCGAYQTEYGWQDGEPTNQDELAERLSEVAITVDWDNPEVQGLRPEHSRQTIELPVYARQRSDISEEALKASIRGGKQHAIVWLSEQRKRIGRIKLEMLKDTIHRYATHKRSIWWCWHKEYAQELVKHIKAFGFNNIDLVTGSTTPAKRAKVLHEWKYGDPDQPRVLVATIASMSAACNLVTAEAAYFLEYDWAPLNIAQAEKRHHRPGSKYDKVYSYYFYIPQTHEEKMLETLLDKIQQQERILPARDNKQQVLDILNRFDDANYKAVLEQVAMEIINA
jgi:hypothetical protein